MWYADGTQTVPFAAIEILLKQMSLMCLHTSPSNTHFDPLKLKPRVRETNTQISHEIILPSKLTPRDQEYVLGQQRKTQIAEKTTNRCPGNALSGDLSRACHALCWY